MRTSKSSGIDELLQNTDYSATDSYEPGTPGRKRNVKPPRPQNGSQAWRALEDRLNEKRLKRKLREIYEDD